MPDSTATIRIDRKQEILMALAEMLEAAPDTRITTARLASRVGVSEAALYRHFPSKSTMYAGLLTFTEDTLFGLIGRLPSEQPGALNQCQGLLRLYLEFCEKNPGITRLLTGRALTGESQRLHQQVDQVYERLETQLKQYLREAELREGDVLDDVGHEPHAALDDARGGGQRVAHQRARDRREGVHHGVEPAQGDAEGEG